MKYLIALLLAICCFDSSLFSQEKLKGLIVFSSDQQGSAGIYRIKPDGTELQKVIDTPANEWSPRISAKNKFITYLSDEGGTVKRYRIKPNGKKKKMLSHPSNVVLNDRNAHISPDGKWLLYDNEGPGGADIFICLLDGSHPINLTNRPASKDYKPYWAPDGNSIVFTSNRDGNLEIYSMDIDGNNQRNISNHPSDDEQPIFSPNGQWISFRSSRAGDNNQELFRIRPDGTGLQQLTDSPSWELLSCWIGNDHIVFGSNKEENWELYLTDIKGIEIKRLSFNEGFDGDPQWLK